MSTTISLACGAPVLDALIAALGHDDLRIDVEVGDGERLPEGVHRIHRDGISTRFTEITVGETFDVRIFSMASPEDIALAIRIVECTARLMGVIEADAEGAGVVAVSDLARIFDADWAEQQAQSGVRVLRALINDGRGPIEMPGPVRPYCIGPRMLAQLDAGPAETAHLRMLDAIRAVQWLRVRTAGIFVAGEERTKLAIWLGDEVVFPPVKYAALSRERPGDKPEVVLIASEHVATLAGNRWRPIDEVQGHIEAFGADEWPAVVEAARQFATTMAPKS